MPETTVATRPSFAAKSWGAAITILVLILLATAFRGAAATSEVDLGRIDELRGIQPTEHVIAAGHYDPTIPEGSSGAEDAIVGQVDETVVWLVALPGERPIAINGMSPWLGCLVQPVTAEQAETFGRTVPDGFEIGFLDPCHGGLWSVDGIHLGGPGTRGLGRFTTRLTAEGSVIVDLGVLGYLES